MKVYSKEDIRPYMQNPQLMSFIEEGLKVASLGKALEAPWSGLHFPQTGGEVHVKSAALSNGEFYVVKIASGFFHNPEKGLASSNGVVLLFDQNTGELLAIFLDEGLLTDVRTALAGAIAAKYLAASPLHRIGIVGTGTQAKQQLKYLPWVTACKKVSVWGRNHNTVEAFVRDPELQIFSIEIASSLQKLAETCDLIVSTTPSREALLFGEWLQPGTHITAVGADGVGKQELHASVFEKADVIIVDHKQQCRTLGDLQHARQEDVRRAQDLGTWINENSRREKHWISVADLTGTGLEDLQVATALYHWLQNNNYFRKSR